MRINRELVIAYSYEGIEYISKIAPKNSDILCEDGSWEADVDCDRAEDGYGYPYMTIWGRLDAEGTPTTACLHGLLNFENYDIRIPTEDLRIVRCS